MTFFVIIRLLLVVPCLVVVYSQFMSCVCQFMIPVCRPGMCSLQQMLVFSILIEGGISYPVSLCHCRPKNVSNVVVLTRFAEWIHDSLIAILMNLQNNARTIPVPRSINVASKVLFLGTGIVLVLFYSYPIVPYASAFYIASYYLWLL